MLRTTIISLFLFAFSWCSAQSLGSDAVKDSSWFIAKRIGEDTVPQVQLREVVIPNAANRRKYYKQLTKLTKNVVKAYPYAKVTNEILAECETELAKIDSERKQKIYMDAVEASLKEEFEGELRKLTFSQGRILIKLIDRETGETSYELIKKLKGGFSAFMWQGFARLFGSNLKSEFDANQEDYLIDLIVRKIESGEIKVEKRERKSEISYSSL